MDGQWLTFEMFEGREGQLFDVSGVSQPRVAVTLARAVQRSSLGGLGPSGESRPQFSLEFHGPVSQVLPQGTYDVEHPDLGRMEIFIVPVGPEAGSMCYEAAFA